ncbi:putative lysozyme [Pseudomonas phage PaBG]|nr:putative lysozyme [Pseudomonas phage PaBG]AGS82078.2 putative lysozyme [Pseudomonas phage PaBG]
MQTSKEKLMAQQLVLFHLGFYKGLIDGIWSTATITAKKKFEADMSFLPAYPNQGLPFGERDKLPKNMYYANGLIKHRELTPEREKEIMDAMKARMGAATREEPKVEVGITEIDGAGLVGPAGEAGQPGPDYPADGQPNALAGAAGQEQKPAHQQQGKPHHHGHRPKDQRR